jgi:signal transduction histidine kinase
MSKSSSGATARQPWLPALTLRSVAIALSLGLVIALLLRPIFITPFTVVLGRTLFLAMVLLLVYALADHWPRRWLPAWLPHGVVQVLAVTLAAPLATLGAYLLSVGGDLWMFLGTPERLNGFFLITGSGLVLGLVMAVVALLREREAQSRSQELQFALERSQLERQALDARLSLLQAQIEPHFLFNTLANVQALVESGSPQAAPVLSSLIAYLRAALPKLHDGQPTLGNELALVRSYLELMQMRMPDRLQIRLDVDPTLATRRFPPMALLTLVENAVRHGIDPAEDGGQIEVGGSAGADGITLWVADTGVGLSLQAPQGTGLANLRHRLAAFFGPGAELRLHDNPPHGLRAEIHLPPTPPP